MTLGSEIAAISKFYCVDTNFLELLHFALFTPRTLTASSPLSGRFDFMIFIAAYFVFHFFQFSHLSLFPDHTTAHYNMDQLSQLKRVSLSHMVLGLACRNCGKDAEDTRVKLSQCARCRRVFYCSRDCQVAHFPLHKAICKAFKTIDEKGVASKAAGSNEAWVAQLQEVWSCLQQAKGEELDYEERAMASHGRKCLVCYAMAPVCEIQSAGFVCLLRVCVRV